MTEVVIRQTADSNCREYHTDSELSDAPYAQVLGSEMSSNANFSKLGGNADSWLKALNGTEGVLKLTLRPSSVKLYKEATVSWPQIEPNIISAFEQTFGETRVIHYTQATRSKVHA